MANHLKPVQTEVEINQSGFDLILSLERPAALAALRTMAGSIQFTMINTADWAIREREKRERMTELGMKDLNQADRIQRGNTDLDQRNAQDENDRSADEEQRNGHPMGFDINETPMQKLAKFAGLYDNILHRISHMNPTEFDLPQTFSEALDWSIANTSLKAVDEDVLLKLHSAGIDDDELAVAGREARDKRQARMKARRVEILQLLEDAGDTNDEYAFESLPLHIQLRLVCSAWKGLATRRKQLVLYIAQTNKLDNLSDIALIKQGQVRVEAWCKRFENIHSVILDEMDSAGVYVPSIEQTIADNQRKKLAA